MGSEVVVEGAAVDWRALLDRLTALELPSLVAMVDGALQFPGTLPPDGWRDVRLRTPAGFVTVARRATGVAVVVFGNADEALLAAQRTIVAALRGDG